MTTIPAPVGRLARAACAMKRVPSGEARRKSRDPAEPPAIGRIGGRESLSTHIGPPLFIDAPRPAGPQPRDGLQRARLHSDAVLHVDSAGYPGRRRPVNRVSSELLGLVKTDPGPAVRCGDGEHRYQTAASGMRVASFSAGVRPCSASEKRSWL